MKVAHKITKNHFEKLAWEQNQYVCGIDEVGRGCLAGPVVVTAAILPINTRYKNLKDSKVMTKEERDTAYAWLSQNCWYSTAIISHTAIDAHNIYQATLLGMKKALLQLYSTLPIPESTLKYVVIDAMPLSLPHLAPHIEFYHMNYGESLSTSIAAASIIAKVTRDELITTMGTLFPAYQLHAHKGYATGEHITAIQTVGQSIIHRTTFIENFTKERNDNSHQQSLF